MKNIWIYVEQSMGAVNPVFYELLGKARDLYPSDVLTAVVLGADNQAIIPILRMSGVNAVISAEHVKLAVYHPDYYAKALAELAKDYQPDVILAGATAVGSELAPSVAAKLDTGLAAHCADLCVDDKGGLVTIIPAFGGKLLGEIIIPEKRPAMATVKPGVFPRYELPAVSDARMTVADTTFLDTYKSRITLVCQQEVSLEGGSIEDADVVICAGVGINSKENWDKAEELAHLLNGVLGYTRPAVDMGYVDNENAMIGTSGKMIRPQLYIGFGVSGATHHVCGMKESQLIININTDENSAAFRVSDYRLIADCGAVLDELLQMLRG